MTSQLLHDLLDRTADERPDAPAVTQGETVVTFAALRDASRRVAAWLAERGVARGDRIVIALEPDPIIPALVYGCSRTGAVFSLISPGTARAAIDHVLADAEPALLICDREEADELAAAHATRADVRAALDRATAPAPTTTPLAVDPVCLIYTSGSTGLPKAVVSTHTQVVFAVHAIQSQLEYAPDDVVYCALPLSFDYGMYQLFLSTVAGCRVELGSPADAGPQLAGRLRDSGATVLPAVPGLAAGLARMLSRAGAEPPRLRLMTNTGAAMRPDVLRALRAAIPGLRVQLMFGLTECKRAAIMPKDEDLHRPGACGRALPGTEILIVDGTGASVPAGELGEIVVRGPNVMAGYWRRPALTAQRFPRSEGLFPRLCTGDHGWLDADGYLHFLGRTDDQYKEHGTRTNVTEVEAAAHRVADVGSAAVLPPDADAEGATLFAVTALAPSELLARLRHELDPLKAPRRCVVVDEIPLTQNGKVDRRRLARLGLEAAGV